MSYMVGKYNRNASKKLFSSAGSSLAVKIFNKYA
jgi:hypothetical protein